MPATIIRRRDPVPIDGQWPASVHPVLRRIYATRGVPADDAAGLRLASLLSPQSLGGLETACALLSDAIRDDRSIVVIGDYDTDGATATAVALRGLRMLGARCVDYRVPNRALHGYGISPALVATLQAPHPDIIVTVDNGIAANAGIAAANALGSTVIVTDHHLAGERLPDAAAIVNPNVVGDAFPSKSLAGVGVVFYLLLALRARQRVSGVFGNRSGEPELASLLDLVALGTVADLVPLDRNNRVLVDAGLRRLRAGRGNTGILALLQSGGRDPQRVVASDLGFVVAPRINAAGRLDDIALGIECLLADDVGIARDHAERLSSINAERREVQDVMQQQAERAIGDWSARNDGGEMPVGVTLYDDDWHAGVVGLVAARIKDRLHRPVVACAPAASGSDDVRGSARSIAGFHIRDALAEVDARHPGLMVRFGGHAMAAGLTLHRGDVVRFSRAFDEVARARLDTAALRGELLTDGGLDAADFSLELAGQLRYGGPWGQAFPEPQFDDAFELLASHRVGDRHWRLSLRHAERDLPLDAMLFNRPELGFGDGDRLRVVYQLDVDTWNGRERMRLLVRHIEAA